MPVIKVATSIDVDGAKWIVDTPEPLRGDGVERINFTLEKATAGKKVGKSVDVGPAGSLQLLSISATKYGVTLKPGSPPTDPNAVDSRPEIKLTAPLLLMGEPLIDALLLGKLTTEKNLSITFENASTTDEVAIQILVLRNAVTVLPTP